MDIRWQQRFSNFNKAFLLLEKAVKQESYNELELQGLIKGFEFTYELAWKTLKDYLNELGYTDVLGSKDSIRLAFKLGIINDGEAWMEMVKSRNLTSHTYDLETAEQIHQSIQNSFYTLFKELQQRLQAEIEGKQMDLL